MEGIRLIDTHCHLAGVEFTEDLVEIFKKLSGLGIAAISSSIEKDEWDINLEISRKFLILLYFTFEKIISLKLL